MLHFLNTYIYKVVVWYNKTILSKNVMHEFALYRVYLRKKGVTSVTNPENLRAIRLSSVTLFQKKV